MYNQQGQLLFEARYNAAKQLHSQLHYIWLNDTPVGFVVKDNNSEDWNIYAIHTDHLNTPRLVTNQNGAEVWRWASDAFGDSQATGSIEFNLRFPGQYYDGESGLHYNYFRDYNAQTGRYVQSDPIGLQGGLNAYGYVSGNPITNTDFYELITINVGLNTTGVVGDTGTNPGTVAGGGSYLQVISSGVEVGGYKLSEGEAAGADVDGSVVVGVTFDSDDFSGTAGSTGFDIGPISVNINFNPVTFDIYGVEIGFGPGKGSSYSETNLQKVPVSALNFQNIHDAVYPNCPTNK